MIHNLPHLNYVTVAVPVVGDVLLTPTVLYTEAFLAVTSLVLGAAHITGGGIVGNASRVLPPHLAMSVDAHKWRIPELYLWIAQQGSSIRALPVDCSAR